MRTNTVVVQRELNNLEHLTDEAKFKTASVTNCDKNLNNSYNQETKIKLLLLFVLFQLCVRIFAY